MKFLLVDDIKLVLEEECSLLQEVMPGCQICSCCTVAEAIKYVRKETFQVAFLDIDLGNSDMDGIMLAKQIKEIQPGIQIIFVTGFKEYAFDAFSVHATGYLLKPIQKEHLQRELTFLYGEEYTKEKRVRVQTFGNFAVWVDDEPLNFGRQKSKELFAYLIERKGAGVTTREACAVLFEDGAYDLSQKSYFQNIVADMRNTFKSRGVEEVICKSYNYLAVNIDKIDCDYYRFLEGDAKAINQYNGEFMSNYSWAEFFVPVLNQEVEPNSRQEDFL